MAEELTDQYWQTVLAVARSQGQPEAEVTKLRSKQLLRSLAAKTSFSKAAVEVAQNINALRQYLRENKQDYAQLGKLSEAERDRIEEEVGTYVRSCSSNIEKLQAMLASAPAAGASPARALPPSPDLLAHRQGMVLILSERLGSASTLFDRMRSLRYQQLQQQEAARQRRRPRGSSSTGPMTTGELHAHLQQQRRQQQPGGQAAGQQQQQQGQQAPADGWLPQQQQGQQQQQQMLVDSENQALQLELLSMGDQVQHAERTVREIATLNQMFSTAILQQSEQIEKLYAQAVEATHNITSANVQLDKAIKTNKAGRKYLLAFFLLASLGLLFLDWFYS